MQKNYPAGSVTTQTLYDSQIGGKFVRLYAQPGYENSCAVRMSYGLNRSGLTLAKGGGASIQGGDGYWYWLRVADLKAELARRFKGVDEELGLTVIPKTLLKDDAALALQIKERVRQGQEFIDTRLAGKNGIVAFEVSGWGDASGHFTLWDGSARTLAYADGHNDSGNTDFYFWLTQVDPERTRLIQTVRVKFWELK
ncbi:type VI secretion system amidase effector protein Tae4 [Duganella levis]|uniref:Type VI secretion system (T6SS) effector Tae4 (Amidase) n=1 Tax=Duganella levis TaxID=2692169 RepID=A0ABW9W723_9BURK|nr:type VI secretion system amidase effector protein Tae4 [Duganella levis]MYN29882.1 hypothetical protein [Duganella levis]